LLCDIERDHGHGAVVLPGHQVGNSGFEIGMLDVGFAVAATVAAEIVKDEINGLIEARRHD
jgi:hypothetical protein